MGYYVDTGKLLERAGLPGAILFVVLISSSMLLYFNFLA